jgi:hypothetical protein
MYLRQLMKLTLSTLLLAAVSTTHAQVPAPAAQASDRVFQPGVRLTYYVGDVILPGEGYTWTPDPEGNWVNRNGDRFRRDENWSSGGYGYNQHTVVAMDDTNYGIETREYVVADPEKKIFTHVNTRGFTARRGQEIGGLWVDPRELAAKQNEADGNTRVFRMQYRIANRDYHAIRIQFRLDTGNYSQRTYDLDTGILLAESTMTTGRPTLTGRDPDALRTGRGTSVLHIIRFEGARQLKLTFQDPRLPEWTRNIRHMAFEGMLQYAWKDMNAQAPPTPVFSNFEFQREGAMLTGKGTFQQGPHPDLLNTAERSIIAGPYSYGQLWLGPANLQQGQVLDEDPYTGVKAFVEAVGPQIVIAESSPWQHRRWGYDANTRMLIWAQNYLDQGVGGQLVNVQLRSTR